MTEITIIGAGMSPYDITEAGRRAIEVADCILGSSRLIKTWEDIKPCYPGYKPKDLEPLLDKYNKIVVLMSGDVGYYSGAALMMKHFENVKLIPGISSVQAFFARIGKPWQDAALISAHGRGVCPAEPVRRNKLTFFLSGKNLPELAANLNESGFGNLSAYVGENLGTESEKILKMPVSDIMKENFSDLTVMVVENSNPDTRTRVGIPDEEFIRGSVPMTKSAVRAEIASFLALPEDAICWDIGCGTGSVTVEMAFAAHKGKVYACDTSQESVKLTRENLMKFHVSNVKIALGSAPGCLTEFPAPHAVFIGGSSGNLEEIIHAAITANPHTIIVMTAITLETLSKALEIFACLGIDTKVRQISCANAKETGDYHLLIGDNPTFIISGQKHPS